MTNDSVFVGGIRTTVLGRRDIVHLIEEKVLSSRIGHEKPFIVFSNNGQAIALYNTNSNVKRLYDQADLVHADGQSVVAFSKLFSSSKPIIERSATTDLITDIPEISNRSIRHFLLGGPDNLAKQAGNILSDKYPNFEFAGSINGFFEKSAILKVIEEINQQKPDILWVGLGKPLEQSFCINYMHEIKVPVVISCGGCFNFVTGDYVRASIVFQKFGLEWLHRLIKDPRKLLFRYLTTNVLAIYFAFKWRDKPNE
jgi:N-acetylglucosaminyldiphosphoundecaprenol N-acetyl-beta-D-mannosaminyltransferase